MITMRSESDPHSTSFYTTSDPAKARKPNQLDVCRDDCLLAVVEHRLNPPLLDCARSSAQRRRPKKVAKDEAIGRSRGGLSTKIHTLVDALGNPVGFHLTGGEAHDLVGADHLLPDMHAEALIADKAFDADKRVIEPLTAAGKTILIPPSSGRRSPQYSGLNATTSGSVP
jgi:Transposase DDE domain